MTTNDHEGSVSKLILQIGIDIGMGKEDGDNRVMATPAGGVKGGPGIFPFIPPIDIQRGILPENILHLFHFAILGCEVEFLLHFREQK